jgi:hypothetical protein
MKQAKIEDILLLRVWQSTGKGMTASDIRKGLRGLFPVELNVEMLKGSCDRLVAAGWFASSGKKLAKYTTTREGAERARSLLRMSKTGKWPKALVAYSLDLSSLAKNAIRIALLRELCAIPEGAKFSTALDTFLLQHLAQPGAKNIEQAVIRRALGLSGQEQKAQTVPRPQSLDLKQFAQAVVETARHTREGWVGNKVFISRVWKEIQDKGGFAGMTFEAFKGHLVQANHQRLLSLSRADLAPLMDQQDVLASEIKHMDATFHFLVVDRQEAQA